MKVFPKNRSVSLALFQATFRKKCPFDEQMDALCQTLESRDRAFVRLVVSTTLRRLGEIDHVITHLLNKALPRKLFTVHDILRLGVAQILFLDIPPHAAVHSSVEIAKRGPFAPYSGLINAVLKRVATEGSHFLRPGQAAHMNTPKWLWKNWRQSWGHEATLAIAKMHEATPPLDITLHPNQDPSFWMNALDATLLPCGTLRRFTHGSVPDLPGFNDGVWWIQDAAASLPARLFGKVQEKNILDICAAPGGKTLQLSAAGACVTSVDCSSSRLTRLADNLRRTGLHATLVQADAQTWRPLDQADGVLLDAPCTATGTIRRHPDTAHRKTPNDLYSLVSLQNKLLRSALTMVRPGGIIVYCTCSLQREEGEAQIMTLLSETNTVILDPITPQDIGNIPDVITPEGYLRTMPYQLGNQGGMDGFFTARLRRL